MPQGATNTVNTYDPANFAKIINGKKIHTYTLKNNKGTRLVISNYGSRLVSLQVRDKMKRLINIIVSFENTAEFQHPAAPDFDTTTQNHVIHINKNGFDLDFQNAVWDAGQRTDSTLELTHFSKNIEDGTLVNVKVTYTLKDDNGLKISYEATTDKTTAVNLANRVFFNLNGSGRSSILNHLLQINADNYIPINNKLISPLKIESVNGTPFDFKKATTIGVRINDNNEQLKNGCGYNHQFLLNKHSSRTPVARIKGDKSGIVMELCTEDPIVEFYSGNFISDDNHNFRTAFVIISQQLPVMETQSQFPLVVLNPDQTYRSECTYRFKITK